MKLFYVLKFSSKNNLTVKEPLQFISNKIFLTNESNAVHHNVIELFYLPKKC